MVSLKRHPSAAQWLAPALLCLAIAFVVPGASTSDPRTVLTLLCLAGAFAGLGASSAEFPGEWGHPSHTNITTLARQCTAIALGIGLALGATGYYLLRGLLNLGRAFGPVLFVVTMGVGLFGLVVAQRHARVIGRARRYRRQWPQWAYAREITRSRRRFAREWPALNAQFPDAGHWALALARPSVRGRLTHANLVPLLASSHPERRELALMVLYEITPC